jgi:putative acetyltransferase
METSFNIVSTPTKDQIEDARALFLEYAHSLSFSLCFQDFSKELETLPGEYAPPDGRLLLAYRDSFPAGCVALRRLSAQACEMKRLYVRPDYRGSHLGRSLARSVIREARAAGYDRMLLDTINTMQAAIGLYRSLGFQEIPAYTENPIKGALYFELRLRMHTGLSPAPGSD